MVEKLAQEKAGNESIADAFRKARPMSVLSEYEFHTENVRQVKGKLIKFNKDMFGKHFPMQKDDMKKLAVFSDRSISVKMDLEGGDATLELLRLLGHDRNAALSIKFSDKFGEVYNYMDIKGIGLPKKSRFGSDTIAKANTGMWGLVARESAEEDWHWSNVFIKNGGKTSAPIAIIEIESVILANGKEVSIEELKKQGVMPPTIKYSGDRRTYKYAPVIYLRAFPEAMRVGNSEKEDLEKFAKEHGMSINQYSDWWIEREAKNVAIIHGMGKLHNGLHADNLTIDGRVVDNDDWGDYKRDDKKGILELAEEIDTMVLDVQVFNSNLGISHLEMPERRALFLEKYLENFKDISKDEFRGVYEYLASNYVYSKAGVERIREMFKRRFGEELEQ